MIRTQIYLPEEMHQFAKSYSRKNKTTLSAMLRDAFEEKFIKSKETEGRAIWDSMIGCCKADFGRDIDHNEIYDEPMPWEK